jgi:uncharacterized phage protein gp47/JayE
MAFQRPTLDELAERIRADFVSRLDLTVAILRRSMVYVLSLVIAGAAHMMHGHLDFLSLQLFPDTASAENLVRWATLFGLTRKQAEFAIGTVNFTGINTTVIPAGTLLVNDGREYALDVELTIVAGVASGTVTAVLAGDEGNLAAGSLLAFVTPIAGIDDPATVAIGGLVNGSDEETYDQLRARLTARMQSPPHGGNAADYIAWALEVAGVTRAWVYPLELGAGTVVVRFVRDDDPSLIPDAGEVAVVQTYIDALRPVTATFTAVAPVAAPIAHTIHIVPDTAALRLAVAASLTDMILRDAEPGGTILLSHIRQAIGDTEGISDYTLTTPAANVPNATGLLATLGVITWT